MQTKSGFTLMTANEFESWLAAQRVTRRITVIQEHHTWSPSYQHFNGKNHFELQANMRSYHKSIKYQDIAQNLTIFPDGQVMTGRSFNVAPAGCKGANQNGICIENLGNFDRGGDTMSAAQKDAIVRVTAALLKRFGLTAESGVTYHGWWTDDGVRLGDYNPSRSCKTCPGTAFFGGNTRAAYNKHLRPLLEAEMRGEENEVVEKKRILIDGKQYECEVIDKDDVNFIKMRSLTQAGYDVVYDSARKLPAITAPQCRANVPGASAEVQSAIDKLQTACGLDEKTVEYLLRYEYGDSLLTKLAAAMK